MLEGDADALTQPIERWLWVGAILTLFSWLAGYLLLSVTQMTNPPPYIVIKMWMTLMAGVGAIFLLYKTLRLALQGERNPIARFKSEFDWKQVGIWYLGSFIISANLAFFGWIKPQLGLLTPFTADILLAEIDHAIFGVDPWRLLHWFDHPGASALYHEGWFVWLAFVLVYLITRQPSPQKNRALISYFLLWSVVGPLVHLSLPAGGPIFFDQLGLGDRFAEMPLTDRTRLAEHYLWDGLLKREFNAGGGISAMPSLHLAMMFWSIIVLRKTRWLAVSIVLTAYIFIGSVALGWHYFVDGLVGGACTLLAFWLAAPALPFRKITAFLDSSRPAPS